MISVAMRIERGGVELAVEVRGSHVPGSPGSRVDPPEDDCFEDVEAFDEDGREVRLSDEELDRAEGALLRRWREAPAPEDEG